MAGDVFEEFVDAVAPLEHGVVVLPRADQMRQGKLLAGQIELQGVGEGDFEGIVFAAGAALEEEFSLFADDEEFWSFAGAAGEFDDGVDDADVEMGEDDGEFFSGELLPGSAGAGLSGTGRSSLGSL